MIRIASEATLAPFQRAELALVAGVPPPPDDEGMRGSGALAL